MILTVIKARKIKRFTVTKIMDFISRIYSFLSGVCDREKTSDPLKIGSPR